MVLAEDLDVDGPVVVVEAFKDISAHAKVLGPTHFVDRTVDLGGCARISPTRRCHEWWHFVIDRMRDSGISMMLYPLWLRLRMNNLRSAMPPRATDT